MLKEGGLTGGSSIMPQKRNPMGIERLRMIASKVIGDAEGTFFMAHNASSGRLQSCLHQPTDVQ
jgi:argininosuccinate lyase